MGDYKLQHYVPQAYLKRFASASEPAFLYVYDKINDRSFRTGTRNIASESYFHDLPELTDEEFDMMLDQLRAQGFAEKEIQEAGPKLRDPKLLEKLLAQYEGQVTEVISRLIEDAQSSGSIPSAAREVLADIIARQYARTSFRRKAIEEFMNKSSNEVLVGRVAKARFPEEDFSNMRVEVTEPSVRGFHLAHLLNSQLIAGIIKILTEDHLWFYGRNKTARPLYTSDNPVARRGYRKHVMGTWEIGFASKGLEVNFPLSSEYVLITRERTQFAGKYGHLDGRVIELSPTQVLNCNRMQIAWSYRQIVCARRDFAEAVRLCRQYPSLRDPNRETVGTQFGPLYKPDGSVSEVYHMYEIAPEMEFLDEIS